jgi:VIT1/CCC1 family predicted Fe2+/Mn2+ transporter
MLPIVLGLVDGVLTALALAAGRLTSSNEELSPGLAFRIALVALLSGAVAFFVARYSELRSELGHAEQELNLASRGRFVTGRLGDAILRESLASAALSSAAAFCGSLLPLLLAGLFPHEQWLAVAFGLATLSGLGIVLSCALHGSPWRWALALGAAGAVVTAVGTYAKVVT